MYECVYLLREAAFLFYFLESESERVDGMTLSCDILRLNGPLAVKAHTSLVYTYVLKTK